jgi:predicted enzyme related to lactoylglutathione lyase
MQSKFIWHELLTTDPEAAKAFYSSVVGWSARNAGMGAMGYTVFEVPGNPRGMGGMMAIPDELKAMGVPPNWTGYVHVEDVDAKAAEFVANGGTIQRPASDIPEVGRFAVVADPHGAVLILFKPLPMDMVPPEPAPGTPGFVGWNELYAGNGEEAFAFYQKMFGWSKEMAVDMGEIGVYQCFGADGVAIGGMMTKMASMPMPCWGFYFTVAALDPAIAAVTAGGGQVVNGPHQVPGGAFIVNCVDPQGAFFSLTAATR